MPIKQLLHDAVEVVCLCGAARTYALTAFRASATHVVFPRCMACGQGIGVTFLPREAVRDLPPDQQARTAAALAIACALGATPAAAPIAMPWPEPGAALAVPLHPSYAKAHETWRAAGQG